AAIRWEGSTAGRGRGGPRPVPGLAEGPQVLVHIAVLNGPNLNLLGEREPEIYGRATLAEIEAATRERARALGVECSWTQTNHEGELVDAIQGLRGHADGALVNAAAFTHTRFAALEAEGLDGVLVTSRANIRYLTGFSGSAALVAATRADLLLVTDFRYDEQARAEAAAVARVEVESTSVWERLFKELATLGSLVAVGYEAHALTVKDAARLA